MSSQSSTAGRIAFTLQHAIIRGDDHVRERVLFEYFEFPFDVVVSCLILCGEDDLQYVVQSARQATTESRVVLR